MEVSERVCVLAAVVVLKPAGPVQVYLRRVLVPVAPLPVSVNTLPTQSVGLDKETSVMLGSVFTVAVTGAEPVHPRGSVTVTVYRPPEPVLTEVTEGVAIALNAVGPLQPNDIGVPPEPGVAVAENVSVDPTHTAPPVDAVTDGRELMLTNFVAEQPVPNV